MHQQTQSSVQLNAVPKTGDGAGNFFLWAAIALVVGSITLGATRKYLKSEKEDLE